MKILIFIIITIFCCLLWNEIAIYLINQEISFNYICLNGVYMTAKGNRNDFIKPDYIGEIKVYSDMLKFIYFNIYLNFVIIVSAVMAFYSDIKKEKGNYKKDILKINSFYIIYIFIFLLFTIFSVKISSVHLFEHETETNLSLPLIIFLVSLALMNLFYFMKNRLRYFS